MNKYRLITIISLVVITVFLIVWDFVAVIKGGSVSTISRVIQSVSSIGEHFTLPFAWGVLTAHLFIYRKWVQEGMLKIVSVSLMGGITLFVVVMDIINTIVDSSNGVIVFMSSNAVVPLLIGGLLGWLLVPQKKRS